MVEKMLPSKRETRRMAVTDARKVLFAQEAEKLIDKEKIRRTAIERVEQSGIVFLDELDKIAGTDSRHGPDVNRQGVQSDLLPIVEGSAVMTRIAFDLNRRTQNIGARRLYTILERVIEKISFEGADSKEKRIEIDAKYVKERLKDVLGDEDLSKFIL